MIRDVDDEAEACLLMAPFSLCLGVLRVFKYQKQKCQIVSVSDLCAKIVAQHFITDEVIHFIMNIPGDGVESHEALS